MTDVGPVSPLRVTEEGTSKGREAPPVDPARLLVKAWEEKVFPVIRRRFRSNTDRQSGLEQIKGALLAGMSAWKLGRLHDLYCFQVVVVVNDVLAKSISIEFLFPVNFDSESHVAVNSEGVMGVPINREGYIQGEGGGVLISGIKNRFNLIAVILNSTKNYSCNCNWSIF